MPFYEYECSNCRYYLEVLQKISDKPLRKCPSCGKAALTRLMSAPVFRLKGSGWYETDFKSDKENQRNLAGAEPAEAAPAPEAAAPAGKEDKAAAKPEAKAAAPEKAKTESDPGARASRASSRRPLPKRAAPRAKAKPKRPVARRSRRR
jgi:putative FmdB family regulatory protein